MTKRGVMRMDRRAVVTGGIALTGLAAAGGARAAGPLAQAWGEAPLQGFTGVYTGSDDGSTPTFIDAPCGLSGTADLVLTAGAASYCAPTFGISAARLPGSIATLEKYDRRLRSLALHGNDQLMAQFSSGGPPAPDGWAISESAAQYQARIGALARGGLEPVWVSVDNFGDAPRFTTVWRKSSAAWEARHGVKSGDLSALTQAMQAKGMRPARFAPYLDAGQVRFAVLYRPAGKHGWQAWVGDDSPDVRDPGFRAQGFALLAATSYEEAGKRRWACIWQRAVDAPQDYIWGN